MKKILISALAVGALALNAPVAMADEPTIDCSYDSVQQEDATGQNYEGAAWGYIVHSEGGGVSIRCIVEVNGTEVASTPTGTGDSYATTAGRVTYAAEDTDVVELCAVVTYSHVSGERKICYPVDHFQIPPQEVIDALDELFTLLDDLIVTVTSIPDPILCPVLVGLAGTYGPIVIEPDGDVIINGVRFWDCPLYGD